MLKKIILFSLLVNSLLLVGCTTTAKAITGPDGTSHQLISGADIESCYEKATEVCGGQYTIVNTSNHVSGSDGTTSTTVNLLVKCKN